jgi:lipopolysaccharide transport system permease protein
VDHRATSGYYDAPRVQAIRATAREWWEGTRAADLWLTLAWYDISLKYRGSFLGPWWITISMGIMLAGLGPLYAAIFNVPLNKFFPYVTLGIIFWQFISTTINDGCNCIVGAGSYLKQSPFPISAFVWRIVARHVIFTAHHFIIFIPVAIYAGIVPNVHTLAFVPGLLLVILTLQSTALLVGVLCARFRDVIQVITSVMQMMMFLTPVFWFPEGSVQRSKFLLFNPFYYLLELMRRPLLSEPLEPIFWIVGGSLCVTLTVAALVITASKRKQLVYWM